MTVIREQRCLRVLLSETETAHYNIDRLLFCRCGFTAETVLLKLYKKAAEQTGFFTAAQRLSIEIYPIQSGGCEIWFSPEKVRKIRVPAVPRKNAHVLTAEFCSASSLVSAIELLYDSCPGYICSELYYRHGKYRLIISAGNGDDRSAFESMLSYTANKIFAKSIAAAVTREHFDYLYGDAIEKIGAMIRAL